MSTINKGYVEEVLGISFRARHREEPKGNSDPFSSPIIHREIKGNKIHQPLKRHLWN